MRVNGVKSFRGEFLRVSVCAILCCSAVTSTRARGVERQATAILPSGAEFVLEIADDPAERARGYMHREEVGPHEGMLFVFDEDDRHGIWMKNCLTPLDIVWLDRDLRVVDVAPNRLPCPPDELCVSAFPARRARYVLELAAGTVTRENLALGEQVVVLATPPLP